MEASIEIGIEQRGNRYRAVLKPSGFQNQPLMDGNFYGQWRSTKSEATDDSLVMESAARKVLGMENIA